MCDNGFGNPINLVDATGCSSVGVAGVPRDPVAAAPQDHRDRRDPHDRRARQDPCPGPTDRPTADHRDRYPGGTALRGTPPTADRRDQPARPARRDRTSRGGGGDRLTVPGELDAGEEDDRQHEHNSCHDHHPRRGLIEAGVLGRGRVHRRGRPRRRLNRGFGCLGHVSIMPRQSPADNQLRRESDV